METDKKILLLGCGILKKEVRHLIKKNDWPMDTFFLDSALHCEFDRLSRCLTAGLSRHQGRAVIVFYGACHPLMDQMLNAAHTFRTDGQNCIDMLLGNELFTSELLAGSFFLLEEWSLRWKHILIKSFGTKNIDVLREMFCFDRNCLLCLRTPCSGDFTAKAEAAGRLVNLPLRWMDVGLDHLEAVLEKALKRKIEEIQCLS